MESWLASDADELTTRRFVFLATSSRKLLSGRFPALLPGFSHEAQVVATLKTGPELRCRPEPIGEPRGRVGANRAPANDDFPHPLRRHADRLGKLVGGKPKTFDVFSLEDLARVGW